MSESRGVDFTLVGRDRDLGAALIGVPQLVFWGATHFGHRAGGVWRLGIGLSRRRIAHDCPTEGRIFLSVDELGVGALLVKTSYADRRHLHEHFLVSSSGTVKIASAEEVLRHLLAPPYRMLDTMR